MQNSFTRQEVQNILVSVFMFSSSNKGCSKIVGKNFREQAETVIKANESIKDTPKSMLSVLTRFTNLIN